MRVLYGLERIPRSLGADDPRLPSVELGPTPLRLNTHPVPAAVLEAAGEGHDARLAALARWLQAQCGDYAVAPRRFITDYLAFVAAELDRHRADLAASLAQYDGLYAVADWTWSALRPLPRAWIGGEQVGMAFWDGEQVIAIDPARPRCPDALRAFWAGETLPRSPFRRPTPEPPLPRSTFGDAG